MSLSTLPTECSSSILYFLDKASLYKCLFVNRHYCRVTIPVIWKDPFIKKFSTTISFSLINTLLLEEEDIFSLIPCTTRLYTNRTLFEYGKFIQKVNHNHLAKHVKTFLESNNMRNIDYAVQKVVDIIYHMIIRKSSTLQEFEVDVAQENFPKIPSFTNYGFKYLRSLTIVDLVTDDEKLQNIAEFLNMVSKYCNYIVNLELCINSFDNVFLKQYLDIIKLQPLKKITIYLECIEKVPNLGLEFRKETLKVLVLDNVDFQHFDLSLISKLKCLEHLEFLYCEGFDHCKDLFKDKLYLKEFKLWRCDSENLVEVIINCFCSESLLKLSLSDVTPRAVKAVKETCPNISFLCIQFQSTKFTDSIIPFICKFSSVRVLNIEINFRFDTSSLVRKLADYLIFVECLYLDFNVDLPGFIYFINNCKANLKKWIITLDNSTSSKDYLLYVNKFQKAHNSLKAFGIKKFGYNLMNEEIEIVDILKSQGIDLVAPGELDYLFH
ncbi:unnamed protein product [Rhizophagus irregularis]|uniref:F-box domain-containing protein n=1 Tax=Rhizophagus irregularis TaxID=588596 RepID=A0A2I1G4X7_9GLOM|nr:hypothetical protein RhiirA4_455323 [Rhizophagus irregularis]CAB4402943.1 unnamed protein product [Rhizophagus irregularis]